MARDYTKNRRDNRQYQKGSLTASAPGARHSSRYTDRGEKAAAQDGKNAGRETDYSRKGKGFADRQKPSGRNQSGRAHNGERGGRQDRFSASGDFEYEMPEGILIGRNPVMEAIKAGRTILKIMIADGAEGSVKKIEAMAAQAGISVQYVNRTALDRASGGGPHQGVVARITDYEYCEVEDILRKAEEKGQPPFIMILDGIEDPHNLGAIIRTADAAGVHGIIIPKNRSAAVTAVVEKTAAGAASYVPVARVTNISRTIDDLKKEGIWITALDMDGEEYTKADFTGPVAFVTGSEGRGISRLVKENCDMTVSIPMKGGVNSLNASNAAAILMYEAVRQRG